MQSVTHETAVTASNRDVHLALINEIRSLERRVIDASNRAKPKFEKRGQMVPRDRLKLLLDRHAPFVELSTLCGYKMHDDDGEANIAGGGLITGIGFISGIRTMLCVSDSGIRGGAATPMGIEKMLRAQDIAFEQKLPYVQMIESAGANLFRQAELFVKGGKTFANLARHSGAGLPVISLINGSSTAGGAYQSGLSDYIIVVRKRSRIFLAGPPLLRSATGEIATEEDLGGAEMHYHIAGTAEYIAENDADGIRQLRHVVGSLDWNRNILMPALPKSKPPLKDPETILNIVHTDYRLPYDIRRLIECIVDGSDFTDFKAGYGAQTVTGHAVIGGHRVGILSNNGPIDAQGAAKAAQFIQLCCQANTPLVFLQNTTGFIVGREAEEAGIVKHGSKMIQAVTNATVPKITINVGASFGAGNYGMCGRGFGPSFLFAWPNAQLSVMGGEQAAKTMTIVAEEAAKTRGEEPDHEALAKTREKVIAAYEAEGRALYATARLWDDGIIDPRDTRRVLIFCLDTCREAAARQLRPNIFGVARF